MGSEGRGHVVLFTMQAPGHYHSFVQLLYHINAGCPGIIVTIAVCSNFAGSLAAMQRNGEFGNIDLRLEEIPGKRPIYDDPKFPHRAALGAAQIKLETELLRKRLIALKGSPDAPTSVVCDMLLTWTKDFADDLGVPWYPYYTGSALWTLLILEHSKLIKAGVDPRYISKETDDFLAAKVPDLAKAPGFKAVRTLDTPAEHFEFPEFFSETAERTRQADGVLHNIAEELDASAGVIPAIKEILGPSKLLCMGPCLQIPGFGKVYNYTPAETDPVERWLDLQQEKSVLFVAFGSIGQVSREAILELAGGIEGSGVPFLWAMKPESSGLAELLPEGFLERTAGRGRIETGWVPQTAILQHPSCGAFLTHCGWNSVQEGVCCGVPFLAWPISADQLQTARYVHDMAKIGITIAYLKNEDKYSYDDVTAREVNLAIRTLMFESEGQQRRANVELLQNLAKAAVVKGGSSYQNIQTFLSQIYTPPHQEAVEMAEAPQ